MNFMELIPSADVRTHMEQTGRTFNDWEQAGILFHFCGLTLAEKAARLRELGGQTKDQGLAQQIEQRLTVEAEMQAAFFQSTPGIFYALELRGEEGEPLGYYARAEDAVRRGKQAGDSFGISKYRLIGASGLPPLRASAHWNPYLLHRERLSEELEPEKDDWDDCWAARASFNADGELCDIYSREMLSIGEAARLELEFSPKRFENMYIELPNPFQCGDIVRVVGRGAGRQNGVVETSQEEWARFQERVKNGLYVDFSDACVTVEFPVTGGFSHGHVSPLYLERCQPEQDEPDHDILEAGSLMLRRKCSLEYFTDCCRNYQEQENGQAQTDLSL